MGEDPSLPWIIQAKVPFRCPSEYLESDRNELEVHTREAGQQMVTQAERRTGGPRREFREEERASLRPRTVMLSGRPGQGGPGRSHEERPEIQEQPRMLRPTRKGEGQFERPALKAAGQLGRARLDSVLGSLTTSRSTF